MKSVGIIGGIGPESTIEYYRSIIASCQKEKRDGSFPSIIINSIDVNRLLGLAGAKEFARLTEYLVVELHKLAKAGADFGVLAANTPHIVFDEVSRQSPIPLISIVEATCKAAKSLGLESVGLFGTKFTMQGGFYQSVFSREGVALVIPEPDDQNYIHEKYVGELLKNVFLPETRERLLIIAERMRDRSGIQGLILGGTELPLILREDDVERLGIPFLDTTRIHVAAIVARLLE